ncbi:MAG: hypothetical protein K5659_09090 [Lachnospiraceae bacterium]|nr:hypothetical protein [Lachnospiraceae bacterium]
MNKKALKKAYAVPGTKANKGQTTGVYFDKEKFAKILKKHGGTQQSFAQEIGRSNTWVYNCMQRGTMAKVDALALQQMFKVNLIIDRPYDDIVAEEKAKKESEEKAKALLKNKKAPINCAIKMVAEEKANEEGYLIISKLNELNHNILRMGALQAEILKELKDIGKELK